MSDTGSPHISPETLARRRDGELTSSDACAVDSHLAGCPQCRALRDEDDRAFAAYRDLFAHYIRPTLAPPPEPWQSLASLAGAESSARARQAPRMFAFGSKPVWLAIAAAVVVCGFLAYRFLQPVDVSAGELLARSSRVALPSGRHLRCSYRGRSFERQVGVQDATDSQQRTVAALFASAGYDWRDPLNAASFLGWRSRLRRKRDEVRSFEQPGGGVRFVRVATSTPDGVLHTARLTLRADTLRPVAGGFDFASQDTVELSETSAPSTEAPAPPPGRPPSVKTSEPSFPVTPEEELRVLNALHAIEADVGEPIELHVDPSGTTIVVTATASAGVQTERLRRTLAGLPRVSLETSASRADLQPARPPALAAEAAPDITIRKLLTDRFGGPAQLQQATDRLLESSASVLALSGALHRLAAHVPATAEPGLSERGREWLTGLRQDYVSRLRRELTVLSGGLAPLLAHTGLGSALSDSGATWQADASAILALSQDVDRLLNTLLAGSYSRSEAESILSRLPPETGRLEGLVRRMSGDR